MNAKGRGIPNLDLIAVAHPLGTRAPDEIAAMGVDVAARVREILGA